MDQYDEYDDPDQLNGIYDDNENEWDSEYEDALTDWMHREAERQARINAKNPHYIPPPISSMLHMQYKEGEVILSDYNQEKLEKEKMKKTKELNAKLISIIKNSVFNFIYIFIAALLCVLGRRSIYMPVDIQHFRQLTWEYQYLIQMVLDSIFDAIIYLSIYLSIYLN